MHCWVVLVFRLCEIKAVSRFPAGGPRCARRKKVGGGVERECAPGGWCRGVDERRCEESAGIHRIRVVRAGDGCRERGGPPASCVSGGRRVLLLFLIKRGPRHPPAATFLRRELLPLGVVLLVLLRPPEKCARHYLCVWPPLPVSCTHKMEVPNKKTELLASFCWVQCSGSKPLQSNVWVCKQKRAIINLQNAPRLLYPKGYRPRPRAHAAPLGVLPPHPPIRSVTECIDQRSQTATTPKTKTKKNKKVLKSKRK